mgnify:CR=1 FL=1
MVLVNRYKDDHEQLEKLTTKIYPYLNIKDVLSDTRTIKSLIDDLISALDIHLAVEDKSLYPLLLNHTNQEIKSTVQSFIDEMGEIRQTVLLYRRKWTSISKIQEEPNKFIGETSIILEALITRMHKENLELFTLLGKEDEESTSEY